LAQEIQVGVAAGAGIGYDGEIGRKIVGVAARDEGKCKWQL